MAQIVINIDDGDIQDFINAFTVGSPSGLVTQNPNKDAEQAVTDFILQRIKNYRVNEAIKQVNKDVKKPIIETVIPDKPIV